MNTLGFHHVALQARDVTRVAEFYLRVLGLPETARHLRDDGSLRSIWVSVGGGHGFLAIEAAASLEPAGALGFSMVALRIEPGDRAHLEATLAKHHVPIERESGWTVYVRDPEGNLVGLSHHPHSRASPGVG